MGVEVLRPDGAPKLILPRTRTARAGYGAPP